MADERPLRSVLSALDPYLSDVVLIGGWVPYLHLRYGRASGARVDGRTSLTREADVLLPSRLPPEGRRPLTEVLVAEGFRPTRSGGVRWRREIADGEEIEFFQPHRGTARGLGRPAPVEAQPELWALSLDDLEVLSRFVDAVELAGTAEQERLVVRVPTLGAFVVAKALTFPKRSGDDSRTKRGKDLLYVRDVAAAGRPATRVLEEDLESIAGSEASCHPSVRNSENHLRLVLSGGFGEAVESAGRELGERDGLRREDGVADVLGHLTDVAEMLEAARRISGGAQQGSP